MASATLRVLTWNLFHGRSLPPAGRSLRGEFAAALAGWRWDVAVLQEVPPWWPGPLAEAAGAERHFRALTSRNWCLPLQRLAAETFPDGMKAGGGGANAILTRGPAEDHRRVRLRWWPERRVAHGVRLAGAGWVANLHATVRDERRAREEVESAAAALAGWAGDGPAILAGDFNLWRPEAHGLTRVAGRGVDHVLVRGWEAAEAPEVLARRGLSDHAPVAVTLRRAPAAPR
jgi:endonuclease/exonuclease/phosphatase family metal-dependent hydrolase